MDQLGRCGGRPVPKTHARYLKLAWQLAGGNPEWGADLDDMIDNAEWMVMMGRIPAPSRWIDSVIARASADEADGMF